MASPSRLRPVALVAVVLALGAAGYWLYERARQEPGSDAVVKEDKKDLPIIPPVPGAAERLAGELKKSGWDDEAARRVSEVFGDWLARLADADPRQRSLQWVRLRDLPVRGELASLLRRRPELAGLLAGARDPALVARTFDQAGRDSELVAGLYVRHAAPGDADRLALALQRHGPLVCDLTRRGLIGAELLFVPAVPGPQAGPEETEYERWLADGMRARMRDPDDDRAAFLQFVFHQGAVLRRRLEEDTGFRRSFRSEVWPRLERVVDKSGTWDLYAGEEHLWDLLRLPAGERLLQVHGRLPIVLLFEPGAYPAKLHGPVIDALLADDRVLLAGYAEFREEPLFRALLARDLPRDRLASAIKRLFAAGNGAQDRLRRWQDIESRAALLEELGPEPSGGLTWTPLFYTFHVGKKLVQGRDVSAAELVMAVSDPVTFAFPPARAGSMAAKGGARVTSVVTRTMRKQGMEQAQKQFQRRALLTAGRVSAREATALAGRLMEKGLEQELAHYSITALLGRMQEPFRQALGRAATVEVTEAVRFLYQYSGVSRETFRRLTGLDARLFMRGDGRVLVRLGDTVAGTLAAETLNRATDALVDDALGGKKVAREQAEAAWRQHVGVWWLMNAGNMPAPRR